MLIEHLVGRLLPERGEVIVLGESLRELTPSQLADARMKIGIALQDGGLFSSLSVYDNVALPLRQHARLADDQIAEIVDARLAEVGLSDVGLQLPGELASGMRKRAGIARALVLKPPIVVFDEPDCGLDQLRAALLCDLIEHLHERHGGTYVVVTHDVAIARQIGEYLLVLSKGRVVEAGDRETMLRSPNPFVRQFLNARSAGSDSGR
jgi:phospholipid/cholesterol/gamma-HCH transport system ATP-binding protein